MRTLLHNAGFALASMVMTLGAVVSAAPAHASVAQPDVPSVSVQVGDLNLDSPAGRATAERRIHAAADQVCNTASYSPSLSLRCRNEAIAGATRTLQTRVAAR